MTAGVEHWKEKFQAELDEIINDVSKKAYTELGWTVQRKVDLWYDRADNYILDAGDAYADGIPQKEIEGMIAHARVKAANNILDALKRYMQENM